MTSVRIEAHARYLLNQRMINSRKNGDKIFLWSTSLNWDFKHIGVLQVG